MSWWPSAGGAAWEWGWIPYPAVWLLLIVIAGAYAAWVRSLRPGRRRTGDPEVSADQIALFAAGLVVLWAALDWPLGALAAGYLGERERAAGPADYARRGAAAAARAATRTPAPGAGAAQPARPRHAAATARPRIAAWWAARHLG